MLPSMVTALKAILPRTIAHVIASCQHPQTQFSMQYPHQGDLCLILQDTSFDMTAYALGHLPQTTRLDPILTGHHTRSRLIRRVFQ
jgi:hypothetical protein